MFLEFSLEQLCSDLSRQTKSLISLNWQVLKVLTLKFHASTLDQCHYLRINLSCKALVNLSMPTIAFEQEVITASITIVLIFRDDRIVFF